MAKCGRMIIDCHAHVFPDAVAQHAMDVMGGYEAVPITLPTVGGLLEHMTQSGVDRAVLCPVATKPKQVGSINHWLLGLGEPRLIPFGAIHPGLADLEAELRRLEQAGVKGLKLQPFYQGFTLDDPRTLAFFELVGDRFLVLMHAGGEIFPLPEIEPTPQRLARLLQRFPKLRLIAAHAGGYELWDEVEEHLVAQRLLFDLSYTHQCIAPAQLRRIIDRHGYEKVLWGSDFPWKSQDEGLQGLRELHLPGNEEEAILGGNFLREAGG